MMERQAFAASLNEFLTGSTLPPDVDARRAAKTVIWPAVLEDRAAAESRSVVCVECPDDTTLSAVMGKGVTRCVEGRSASAHSATRQVLSCSVQNFLVADLTTETAYKTHFPQHFRRWLEEATEFDQFPSDAIETALTEAVVNGLVHGNMELRSQFEDGDVEKAVTAHEVYYETIEDRLMQPGYKRRRLAIAAWWDDSRIEISVYDEGPGYDVDEVAKRKRRPRYSGRGIDIIAAMCESYRTEDKGRCITMRFDIS